MINAKKCGALHMSNNNPINEYEIDSQPIANVKFYKDVGITVDARMSLKAHILILRKKTFFLCKSLHASFSPRNYRFLAILFKVYVLPILTYGLPFFFPRTIESVSNLDNVQRKLTKIFLRRTFPTADYNTRLAILDLQPIELTFLKYSLIYLFKMVRFSHPLKHLLPKPSFASVRNATIKFQTPALKSNFRKFLFPVNLIYVWNSLPPSLLSSPSVSRFRQGLEHVDLSRFLKGHT